MSLQLREYKKACVCVYKICIKSENGQTTDNDRPAGLQAGRNLLDWKEAGAGGMQSDK